MSYTSPPPPPPVPSLYYSSTPPAPPPKPSTSSTPSRGPPLPPPPPQTEPLELDGGQGAQYQQQQYSQQYRPQEQYGGRGYYQQQQPQQSIPDIPPVEAGWLPDSVREKTTTDLHHLLHTPSLQNALLANPSTTHPSVPLSQSALQPLLTQNLALTKSLSNLESTLAQRREATQSRLLSLRALEQQHSNKVKETEQALAQFSPMALYQRLNAGVAEQELLVRSVEESWLDEPGVAEVGEVEAFVRRVREGEKGRFLRGERRERWDEGRVGGWR